MKFSYFVPEFNETLKDATEFFTCDQPNSAGMENIANRAARHCYDNCYADDISDVFTLVLCGDGKILEYYEIEVEVKPVFYIDLLSQPPTT